MKILVKALRDDVEFALKLRLVVGEEGLSRCIEYPRIQKPGLAVAGLGHAIGSGRIQVLGKSEIEYISRLSSAKRHKAIAPLAKVPCVVVTAGLEAPPELGRLVREAGIALFTTPLSSGTFINRVHRFLDEHLSPETTVHGVLLDVFGVGVLLAGQSGIGKSECALDLILRGHRLVADDVVLVRNHDQTLIGIGSPLTMHHMEVRGLGIINVRDLFGAASVCERKQLELMVEMVEWDPAVEHDRLGVDDAWAEIMDVKLARVRLPIRPGRNVASIVEVAARNYLLKQQGHHSAREFKETLERRLAQAARDLAAPTTAVDP